jgi:hypothetical protein
MVLWWEWIRCVQALRPACARGSTFGWRVVVLAGLSMRADLAGVSSFPAVAWADPSRSCPATLGPVPWPSPTLDRPQPRRLPISFVPSTRPLGASVMPARGGASQRSRVRLRYYDFSVTTPIPRPSKRSRNAEELLARSRTRCTPSLRVATSRSKRRATSLKVAARASVASAAMSARASEGRRWRPWADRTGGSSP